MGRVYVRKSGARKYKQWSEEQMDQALYEIREKKISLRQASKRYCISRTTLSTKLKDIPVRKPGAPPVFSPKEEQGIASHLKTLVSNGFSLNRLGLRLFIYVYLSRNNRNVPRFYDNMPGKEWADLFLKRNKEELSELIIRRTGRFQKVLDISSIHEYFDNLNYELLPSLPNESDMGTLNT
ncbi:hypothetical protein JTE90_019339 [Oedothorax gibbosus]|uniref:HTH psq-type domain-containing protein n=1 Tax=Oedothorax gibbosus TaxID=931172 RepID=A0AAV6UJZ1_9ARAC|nr:hypothetical protein JTE90_019339 [Oedothorax gibbosus]